MCDTLILWHTCIVVGDFSIDIIKDSVYKNRVIEIMQGYRQYVREATRIIHALCTLIDHVYANEEMTCEVLHTPKITDHAIIYIVVRGNKEMIGDTVTMIRDSRNINLEA